MFENCNMIPQQNTKATTKIHEMLSEIGVPSHLSGHKYLVDAITLAVEDYSYIRTTTIPCSCAIPWLRCETSPYFNFCQIPGGGWAVRSKKRGRHMAKTPRTIEKEAIDALRGELNAQRWRYGYTSFKSLGDALGIAMDTANNYIKRPEQIRVGTLRDMVKLLKPNPMIVLAAVGYTARDIKKFAKEYCEQ